MKLLLLIHSFIVFIHLLIWIGRRFFDNISSSTIPLLSKSDTADISFVAAARCMTVHPLNACFMISVEGRELNGREREKKKTFVPYQPNPRGLRVVPLQYFSKVLCELFLRGNVFVFENRE